MRIPHFKNLFSTRYLSHRLLSRFIMEAVSDESFKGVVIDIGAGAAPYRRHFNPRRYLLLDAENRSGDPNTIIADLNTVVPLADASVDAVICTEVLEHIKNPLNALTELSRILKSGGTMLLTTPMVWTLHEEPHDFFRFTKYGLDYLLKKAGFRTIEIRPSNSYGYTLCQLAVLHMRSPWYKPVVAGINALGLLWSKISVDVDRMPLRYFVIAHK